MKSINLTFDDADFERLRKAKEREGLTWEKFFIELNKLNQKLA